MRPVETLRFIGEDGSMGYRHGQEYRVHVREKGTGLIWVEPVDSPEMRCPYEGFAALMRNWQPV